MEKYFIQNNYTGYLVRIFKVGFVGISTEIFGKITFDKGNVDNILDTIRGTSLDLNLEASQTQTFEEFSEADEKTYSVIVTKNGSVIFNGFLKPDGVSQSFVADLWFVKLDFIDGLGTLKDLSFVDSSGFPFVGKMSMYDVIKNCLARTGIVMTINSFIDVHYLGYSGLNILKDTYVKTDRFVKVDNDTIMTCEEILNSILNLFSACITQYNGQWWIYRPNEFINNVTFIDNTLNTTFTKNLYLKIGSQIDNFYPHHCGTNQAIMTKGAISAYRLNYKYGFKTALNRNTTLAHNSSLVYDYWTQMSAFSALAVNVPGDLNGLILEIIPNLTASNPVLKSESVFILATSQVDLVVDITTGATTGTTYFYFEIKRDDNYWVNSNGAWQNSFAVVSCVLESGMQSGSFTLKAEPVPADCNITVTIQPVANLTDSTGRAEINKCALINNFNYDGRIGEFHTVQRLNAPSSIIKPNQEVFNGDSINDIFDGAIYKSDQVSLTTLWTRKGKLEEKFLLRISAEDDMRIQQKSIKTFTGDFYGEVPYLSIIEINNISGLFMFIEHNYDTDSNITKGKLQQFYTNEVADLEYNLTFDYGKTVKPSIRS